MKAILIISLLFFFSCGKKKSTKPVDEPASEATVSAPADETANQSSTTEEAPTSENPAIEEASVSETANQNPTNDELPFDSPILPPTEAEEASARQIVPQAFSIEEIIQMNADYCREPVTFCMNLCNTPRERYFLFHQAGPELNAGQNFRQNMNLTRMESCIESCKTRMTSRTGCPAN